MDKSEYLERIQGIAASMARAGFSGTLLSAEANVDYYCGFRHHAPWSLFARPYLLLINADARAALVTHSFLASEMERSAAVEDIRSYTRSGHAPVALVVEVMRELGMDRGRIGAELGYEQRLGMSWEDLHSLSEALSQVMFCDVSDQLWRQRMIKSPAELALLRQAVAITDHAFQACFAAARPGVSEKEIARVAAETMIHHGADRPGFVLVVSGIENYRRLSGKPTERQLQRGDMLWIDMGAVYQGYWADFCRAAVIGKPTSTQIDLHDTLLEVNQQCLDAVRIGQPVSRVAQTAESAFAARGVEASIGKGRIGHGIGLMATEPPHVALYEQTLMQEGLVFTIEPRVVNDAGIFNCEEELVVCFQGPELLTTAPRELTVID